MLVKTYGCAICGVGATLVTIEVNVSSGIEYMLVGLPDNAVRESKHRIESAINQSSMRFPGRKIVINMAPADL